MENKKPKRKIQKFREVLSYFGFGFMLGLDVLLGYFLYKYRAEFFNLTVDFSKSIELGFVVVKAILLIFVIVMNLKALKAVLREWKKETFVELYDKREGKEEYKRLGLIRRGIFFWRVNGARKWMDKYHEEFARIQKTIGRVRGDETKELQKLKKEMIKGVLLWTDDFQITRIERNKKGEVKITNEPVTEKFLESLYLSEIYEDYLLKCVDTAERFINGRSELEKGEEI